MRLNTPEVRKQLARVGIILGSIGVFLLVWQTGSVVYPRQIPALGSIASSVLEVLQVPGPRGNTGVDHLRVSLTRVFTILAVAMLLSVLIGIIMGVSSTAEEIVSTWLPFSMTAPDVVVILIVMIILGFDGTSIVLAVIFTATPFGVVNMWAGMREIDGELLEMATAYESSRTLVWRYIYIPHLLSYLFASSRYMLGMIWKIVLVGEAFATSDGMGAIIRFWYNQGEITPIIAYLVLFMAVMAVIEYGVIKSLEFRLFAWRDD